MNRGVTLIVLLVLSFVNGNAQPTGHIRNEVRKSVVQVTCGGKVGTGFLWKYDTWVVTALHVVSGSSDIRVRTYGSTSSARVIRVLKEHDLVLLQLDNPAPSSCRKFNDEDIIRGNVNMGLYTMGYHGEGNPETILDRVMRYGYSSDKTLSGLIPSNIRAVLNNSSCKSPDPDIEVISIDGALLPGFSGAPIISESGKLVGIADGGLEKGQNSICWGIPANQLESLRNSSFVSVPNLSGCNSSGTVQFSADYKLDIENTEVVNYNGYSFIKTRTRTVRQMMQSVDDPLGLNQLVNRFSFVSGLDFNSFRYDIYEDITSGATICVPEGMRLHRSGNWLKAGFPEDNLEMLVWISEVQFNTINPLMTFNPKAVEFQQLLVQRYSNIVHYPYQMDRSLSQTPSLKPGGIAANRVSFMGYRRTCNFGNGCPSQTLYTFQTLIGRNRTFVGATAVDKELTPQHATQARNCANTGNCNQGFCVGVCRRASNYCKLIIGVHMTGFSNS